MGLEHHVLEPSLAELLREELPACVRVLQSFDPMSLRNDMAGGLVVALPVHQACLPACLPVRMC